MAIELRLRAFLTPDEVASLLRAAKKGRHGVRNHAMILIAHRHGLRASEVTGLRVSDVDLKRGTIYCRRAKNSRSSLHPLKPDEAAALEWVLRQLKSRTNEYVFQSERAEKLSRSALLRSRASGHGCQ